MDLCACRITCPCILVSIGTEVPGLWLLEIFDCMGMVAMALELTLNCPLPLCAALPFLILLPFLALLGFLFVLSLFRKKLFTSQFCKTTLLSMIQG